MFINLIPGSGPRTKVSARAIADACLEHMRNVHPGEAWALTITFGPELRPVETKIFRSNQHSKAFRWLVRELTRPGTAVAVSMCLRIKDGGVL
jgi:O-acetyl-ADP-ribose deacetylase (regulator of RNase III)